MALLSVEDLHVAYGPVHALRGVNLEVAEGAIVAIIGANGAGKTPLLNTLSGIVKPKSGSIRLRGERVGEHLAGHQLALAQDLLGEAIVLALVQPVGHDVVGARLRAGDGLVRGTALALLA